MMPFGVILKANCVWGSNLSFPDPKMAGDLKQKLKMVEELLKKYKVGISQTI